MSDRPSRFESAPVSAVAAVLLRRPRQARALAFLVLAAVVLGATVAPASTSLRISAPGAQPASDIAFIPTLPQISSGVVPYAVYLHDAVIDGAFELWSVPLAGGTPVMLSDNLSSGQAPNFALSPLGDRVVYRIDQETAGQGELYSIPIAGPAGAFQKLNPHLLTERTVTSFLISPTGERVFYLMDLASNTKYELYTVPISGGTSLRLNETLLFDYDVEGFRATPDGETLIYRAGRTDANDWALFTVPTDGTGPAARISPTSSFGAVDQYFQISPNSARVVFLADLAVFQRRDLHSAPAGDGTVTQLNTGVAAGSNVDPNFLITPDPSSTTPRVVFRATTSGGIYQLYSVPLGGGTVVRLNGALGSAQDVETDFGISADGSQVVYRSDEAVPDVIELYSVPIAGGTRTRLNGVLASDRDVLGLQISSDGLRVVYRSDELANDRNDLFSVSITGTPARVRINSSQMISSGDVQNFRISPDSNWVVFGADAIVDGKDELFAVPIAGGTIANVSELVASDRDVVLSGTQGTAYAISSNSQSVLYAADQDSNDKIELYDSSLAGPPGAPTVVNATAGNAQATVTFAAPVNDGGSAITGYTVFSDPAGGTDSNAGSTGLSHLVTGLTNGLAYTFTVQATNANGTSVASAPSDPVTPATVPSAPTGVAATPRNASADVVFAASASNGGSAISGYTVISNPPGGVDIHQGTLDLSHLVTGLTNGLPYTFTVVAQNAVGQTASAPSAAVTPGCVTGVGANLFCDGVESSDTSQWDLTVSPVPPGPPTDVVASALDAEAQVTFVAPLDDGGIAITGYTVISNPPGGVDSNAGSTGLSHLVTGLTNGTPYTFTVTATNGVGTGDPSQPSNQVTPNPPS